MNCADGGKCHHFCLRTCWREKNCAPLSGVFPDNEWPSQKREIKPRTDKERLAFVSGFAEALLMVDNDGVKAAKKWLMDMVESEQHMAMKRKEK